jgi:hypothetical protein
LVIIAGGSIFNSLFGSGIILGDLILLTLSFYATAVICLSVFLKGQVAEIKSQPFYTLVSITLKFLIELIIALIWFLIAKKTSLPFVLLFFVLYLTFTIFSIFVILNTLKNKSL